MQQPEVEIGLLRRVATLEIEMRQVKEMLRVFENKTFNQSEAARMLNISSNTLARYRRLGMITPIDGNELALILEKVDEQIITEVLSKQPKKVIALDRIFKGNDQLKTNTALQMKDAGVEFKTI
jgi:adenine-specific DNA-methyltransferase